MEKIWEDEEVMAQCVYPGAGEVDGAVRELYRGFAIFPQQTHSTNIKIVGASEPLDDERVNTERLASQHSGLVAPVAGLEAHVAGLVAHVAGLEDTDGVVTFERGLPIGVVTADCVPILVYMPDIRAVAALHAGWKGTLNGIVDSLFDLLDNADPAKMKVFFGPSISMERYEVDEELARRFIDAGFGDFVAAPTVKPHIDLQGVNVERFLRRGVRPENIHKHPGCTFASRNAQGQPLYPSHRRSGGAPGRLLTCITLR